jgi:hypothetical protein
MKKAIKQKNCSRIATLAFFEVDCACGVTFALVLVSLALNPAGQWKPHGFDLFQ